MTVEAGMLSQVENDATKLSLSGTKIIMKLTEHKVPAHAKEVIVYARVRCGYMKQDVDGEIIIESAPYKRMLYFHTYKQSAWSFNSDYFTLPISEDRTVRAYVQAPPNSAGNFVASVKIVGYTSSVGTAEEYDMDM